MTALSLLLAIFKAIPTLKQWFDELVALYVQSQIATMKEENKRAIHLAIQTQDQRRLEEVLGNPNAGERSNVDGSEIRDSLPGVQ